MPSRSIAVIGGGVLGMTLARRLRTSGHEVTLMEAAAQLGGLAGSARHGPYLWDRFYHVTLLSDLNLRGLLDELGLGDRLEWRTTRTGFYVDGSLYSLSTSLEFALFPPLSLVDKARLAGTIMYASRLRDWKRLEEIPVGDWLERLSGKRVYERIWLPLLRAKLGDNYREASAAFIWAIIQRMYSARRSGLKREMFGYVDGGYALVLERLRGALEADGVEILTGHRVTAVRQLEQGAEVAAEGVTSAHFDHVVLTLPCGRIASLVPQLSEAERHRLRSVTYQGIVCASVLLRRPLGPYYVTNITDGSIPFTGVIEMTALVDRAEFGGNSLVYLPRYVTQADPIWQQSDEQVRLECLAGLERMYPEFRRADVLALDVSRVREVLALSTLRYSSERLPPLETSLPDVSVVNGAQIAQGTLNVNETVGLANRGAIGVAERIKARPVPRIAAAGAP